MDLGIPKKEKAFCKSCNTYHYEQFNFVEKSHQNSNLTNLIILDKMKNINNTATSIAAELNVSDTYVHYTFMQYVNLSRLHLPEVLCIDEVYMHFNKKTSMPASCWTGNPVRLLIFFPIVLQRLSAAILCLSP